VAADQSAVLRYYADKTSTVHGWTLAPSLVSRASTSGSPSGQITAVVGDATGVSAGTAPTLAATAGVSSTKALAWTLVLPPA
jgi:hypothetical protein